MHGLTPDNTSLLEKGNVVHLSRKKNLKVMDTARKGADMLEYGRNFDMEAVVREFQLALYKRANCSVRDVKRQ